MITMAMGIRIPAMSLGTPRRCEQLEVLDVIVDFVRPSGRILVAIAALYLKMLRSAYLKKVNFHRRCRCCREFGQLLANFHLFFRSWTSRAGFGTILMIMLTCNGRGSAYSYVACPT